MSYSSHDKTGLIRVLSFLKSHDTEYLSGQDLSDVLKISRVAVWKHIKNIRDLGYGIESGQKTGYRLVSGTKSLLPWEITSGLNARYMGRHAHYFKTLPSTQECAASMAAGGAADGTVVVAESQSDGKGRDGRSWISPRGGIWLSIILRPKFDISVLTLFPLAAALALSNAIKSSQGMDTELKWPNDLTIRGKKVAGILADASLKSNRIEHLILGVGINFEIDVKKLKGQLRDMPNFYGVAALARKDKKAGPVPLVRAFLEELEATYGRLNMGDTRGIVEDWTRLSSTIGRNVRISTLDGVIGGKAIRLDDDGALVITSKAGTARIVAGDVIHG